jgi:hypothetical protein
VEGYQKKQQLKKGKKKKAEADSTLSPNPSPTIPTQAGYTQNPLGLTNLPLGLGNFMYPATVPGMGLGGLGLNSPNIILQTSMQQPAQLTPQAFNLAQQVPPSSPLSAGADPLRRLEEYVEWHVNRTPGRTAPFRHAYSELKDRMYEFTDLHTITHEEWTEMGVLPGVSKALKRDMKKYQRSLHDVESGSNNEAEI